MPVRREVHRITGWLHTDGTDIVDARGRVVRFAGVDVSGMGHGWGSAIPRRRPERVPQLGAADAGGVRQHPAAGGSTSCGCRSRGRTWSRRAPRGGVHTYNLAYVRALQRTVTGFTSRGVAVVLEMAQNNWSPAFAVRGANHLKCGVGMPLWLYGASPGSLGGSSGGLAIGEAKRAFFANRGDVQAGYAAAWRFVARRFARNHLVVGADMMNEPFTLGAFPTLAAAPGAVCTRAWAARSGGPTRTCC